MLTKNFILKKIKELIPEVNICTNYETRLENSQDKSIKYISKKNIADIVVYVETPQQVMDIVTLCKNNKIPIVCRGAGTNTVGSCVPTNKGIVLNFEKMNKIIDINVQNMSVTLQPGVIVGDLQREVEKFGLFYPPDPANLKYSTIGGSIAQNSAGARCFKYGATKDYVLELKIVTGKGELITVGSKTAKNATGYNLKSLFVGAEGTLGIVVEATLKLIPMPETQQVIMAYYKKVEDSIATVNSIILNHLYPSTIDFMDKCALNTVEEYTNSGILCDNEALLLIEIDGSTHSIDTQREKICEIISLNKGTDIRYSQTPEERENIWAARRVSMTACTKIKPDVTTDDIIVPRQNLATLVHGIQDICKKYNLFLCLIGHVGDGSIHPQIPIDLKNKDEYKRYKQAKLDMYQLTLSLDGIISGEHGIGLEKKSFLSVNTQKELTPYLFEIKKLFDPCNILNPGKIYDIRTFKKMFFE